METIIVVCAILLVTNMIPLCLFLLDFLLQTELVYKE